MGKNQFYWNTQPDQASLEDNYIAQAQTYTSGYEQLGIFVLLELSDNPERLIIHFFKDMSQKEIKPILNKLHNLGLNIPVFIITINKTESSDIIA